MIKYSVHNSFMKLLKQAGEWRVGSPNLESELNEFESRLKSAKNQFQLSSCLNLETLNALLSGATIFEPRLKFKPLLKSLKFSLRRFKFEI